MKKRLICLGTICLSCIIIAIVIVAVIVLNKPKDTEPHAVLTWIDDDTATGYYENAHEIASEFGINMTFACITSELDDEKIEKLLSYQREGHHITTHSVTHDNMNVWGSNYEGTAKFDAIKAEEELKVSIDTLKKAGFENCDYFVAPGGVEFQQVKDLVAKYCPAMVVTQFSGTLNFNDNIDKYALHREFIDASSDKELSYYTGLIDEAIKEKAWIILGTHSGIQEQWDENLVKEVIKYAMAKEIDVKTLHEAYQEKVNLMQ